MNIEWIGILAGLMTTTAFVPQVYKTWKSKSAKDLSLGMFLIFVGGVILWLVYGTIIKSTSIILANALTLIFSGMLLVFKLIFKD